MIFFNDKDHCGLLICHYEYFIYIIYSNAEMKQHSNATIKELGEVCKRGG